MGQIVRILTKDEKYIPLSEIRNYLYLKNLKCMLKLEYGTETQWKEVSVQCEGNEIFFIERDSIKDDAIAKKELKDFKKMLKKANPTSAADWLKDYLEQIEVVYAIEIFPEISDYTGWEILSSIQNYIFKHMDSAIIQSNNEGFTNEEGFHILWQFTSKNIHGKCYSAVLDRSGTWKPFVMDLSNEDQILDFQDGIVPNDVVLL